MCAMEIKIASFMQALQFKISQVEMRACATTTSPADREALSENARGMKKAQALAAEYLESTTPAVGGINLCDRCLRRTYCTLNRALHSEHGECYRFQADPDAITVPDQDDDVVQIPPGGVVLP